MSSKKRAANASSDFKRVKAKVGKRAPKPANLTETEFKTVSVDVRAQSVAAGPRGERSLVSSQGRSWIELLSQLHHPATAVRLSALRGLRDAVSNHAWRNHLSSLLPPIAKSACVDEDDDVRSMGYKVWEQLLSSTENNKYMVWRPFLPLSAAFVASGLNSLDRKTRRDGAKVLYLLSRHVSPLSLEETTCPLLPTFTVLLVDHALSQAKRQQQTAASNKQSQTSNDQPWIILQSLVSLLENSTSSSQKTETNSKDQRRSHDLVFQTGGRSKNALLLTGRPCHPKNSLYPMQTIEHLRQWRIGNEETSDAATQHRALVDNAVLAELFGKLRDVYLEILQRGVEVEGGGVDLKKVDAEEILLVVSAIHGLWTRLRVDRTKNTTSDNQLETITNQLTRILLESFPVRFLGGGKDPCFDTLNGQLCYCLMDMLPSAAVETPWLPTLLSHLLPQLQSVATQETALSSSSTIVTMDVVSTLLLSSSSSGGVADAETQNEVLNTISRTFFSSSLEDRITCSLACRKAVKLVCQMLEQVKHDMEAVEPVVGEMVLCLPGLLRTWWDNYLDESREILEALHQVLRRINPSPSLSEDTNAAQGLLISLRQDLGRTLLVGPSQQPKHNKSTAPPTLLEAYPLDLQRRFIALIVLMQSPSEVVLKGLAKICARQQQTTLATLLVESMHNIRRTIAMPHYLSFLMNSIGVNNSVFHNEPVLRASKALVRCGTDKVVSLVTPVILSWLEQAQQKPPKNLQDVATSWTKFRVAVSLLAMLSRDLSIVYGTSFFGETKSVKLPLIKGIIHLFSCCPRDITATIHDEDEEKSFKTLMQPVEVLLVHEKEVRKTLLQECGSLFCEEEASLSLAVEDNNRNVLEALTLIARSTKLVVMDEEGWLDCARRIKAAVAKKGGRLERQGEVLLTTVQWKLGTLVSTGP